MSDQQDPNIVGNGEVTVPEPGDFVWTNPAGEIAPGMVGPIPGAPTAQFAPNPDDAVRANGAAVVADVGASLPDTIDLTGVAPSWFHVSGIVLPALANASCLLEVIESVVQKGGIVDPAQATDIATTRKILAGLVMQEHGRLAWEAAVQQAAVLVDRVIEDARVATARDLLAKRGAPTA